MTNLDVLNSLGLRAKLAVSRPFDADEREAERAAEAFAAGQAAPSLAAPAGGADRLQRQCAECDGGTLHRKAATAAPMPSATGPPAQGGGGGTPLPRAARAPFERFFRADLAQVRVHDDARAHAAAAAVNAHAFVHGSNLYFARGRFRPDTADGRRLLAHELAHTLQRGSTGLVRRQGTEGFTATPRALTETLDVSRMTTRDIEVEALALRELLLSNPSHPDYAHLEGELLRLDAVIAGRQGAAVQFERALPGMRERQRAAWAARALGPNVGGTVASIGGDLAGVFAFGFAAGFRRNFPEATAGDILADIEANSLRFYTGYQLGSAEGLYHGLVNLLDAIWMLLRLGAAISPVGIAYLAGRELVAVATEGSAHLAMRRAQLARLAAIADALADFAGEVAADPTILSQLSGELGLALGEEAAAWVAHDFAGRSAFAKGRWLGDIAGQIAFEIILEIVLAAVTAGVGNAIRGGVAVGQGVRAGGRLAAALRRALEGTAGFRRLLRAVGQADEAADLARAAERVEDAVPGARAADEAAEAAGGLARAGEDVPGAGLLQRQRAAALREQAADLDHQAEQLERNATRIEAARPEAATRARERASDLRRQATGLREEAEEFASGRRSASADLPGPEDVEAAFPSLHADQPMVRIGLSAAERGEVDLPRLSRELARSRSGHRVVFRVEGGGSRERVAIDAAGNVRLQRGATIHFNFGSEERAREFLEKRSLGSRIIAFEVEEQWIQSARSGAIPEAGTRALSGRQPRLVDVTYAEDQLEVPSGLVHDMEEFIVPGSGRIVAVHE